MQRVSVAFGGTAPALIAGIALTVSGASTYWDIASHVDGGRERFLTPPHVGIYSGVTIALAVIALAMLSDRLRDGASLLEALRHPFRDVRPGLAAAGTGMATALAAAPFDNAWHEIYGIDITIWSPPHLLAIFGVSVAAFGLAMLVAPAAGSNSRPLLHHFLLSSFLAGLIVTTGEFEFNGPQYRIAYHPMILSAAATMIFAAAARGTTRWAATRVALWFEGARLVSLAALVVLDHSLPFVPVVVPAALVIDYLSQRGIKNAVFLGTSSAIAIVMVNWLVLLMLPAIKWQGDDFVIGGTAALIAGAVSAALGTRLGDAIAGRTRRPPQVGIWKKLAVASVLVVAMIPFPASAHEVGGDAGRGVISWMPAEVEPGREVRLRVEDLEVTSGADIESLRLEAWRAEHRIRIPLQQSEGAYEGRFTLPDEGPWMLLLWVRAGGDSLLTTQQLDVDAGGASKGTHREAFTLGLDTLAESEPPAWLDILAYTVAAAILGLLLRGLLRSLVRLAIAQSSAADV